MTFERALRGIATLVLAVGCGGRSTLGEEGTERPPLGCMAAENELIVLTDHGDLHALRIPTLTPRLIARRTCGRSDHNSLAVSRRGGVLIGYTDGALQAVAADATCAEPFEVLSEKVLGRQLGAFGMNFVGNGSADETLVFNLHYYEEPERARSHLATFDLDEHELYEIGPVAHDEGPFELAGTSEGALFGYQLGREGVEQSVLELDLRTASVVREIVTGQGLGLGYVAVAASDEAIYAFGAKSVESRSRVLRVDRATSKVQSLGDVPFLVVGAGASACAADAASQGSELPAGEGSPEPR